LARVEDETIRNVSVLSVGDPLLGQVVEQYKVESVIGSGAMGIVYRGVHQVIGKPVAIKVLRTDFADDPEMVQRLLREARSVNAIRHPAIVDIFGFGTLPRTEQPYIVMDLLDGQPLDEYLKARAPLKPREAAAFIDELLSALSAAHTVGVIHRDLKPGNIFVESKPDGKKGIKVIDFGLAKKADRAGGSVAPTNPGTLLGTPAFMAPEQVLGTKVVPATDLYAVGGILYQMLTNHLPHEAPSAIEVLSQKMAHDPISPKQWQNGLDDELDGWVMNLLRREPERRMASADEARRALRRIMDGRTASGNKPALNRGAGAMVPKREWADAKTVVTDDLPVSPSTRLGPVPAATGPQASTGDHVSPWAKTSVELPLEAQLTAPGAVKRLDVATVVVPDAHDVETPVQARAADPQEVLATLPPTVAAHGRLIVLLLVLIALLAAGLWYLNCQ
jgi:serine/threonine protein kinase